jgi:hypothetical protein
MRDLRFGINVISVAPSLFLSRDMIEPRQLSVPESSQTNVNMIGVVIEAA